MWYWLALFCVANVADDRIDELNLQFVSKMRYADLVVDRIAFTIRVDEFGELVPAYGIAPRDAESSMTKYRSLMAGRHGTPCWEYRSGLLVPGSLEEEKETRRTVFLPKPAGEVVDLKHLRANYVGGEIPLVYNLPGLLYRKGEQPKIGRSHASLPDLYPLPEQSQADFDKIAKDEAKIYVKQVGQLFFFGSKGKHGEFKPHPKLVPKPTRPKDVRFVDYLPAELLNKPAYERRVNCLLPGTIVKVSKHGQRVFKPTLGAKILPLDSKDIDQSIPIYNKPD